MEKLRLKLTRLLSLLLVGLLYSCESQENKMIIDYLDKFFINEYQASSKDLSLEILEINFKDVVKASDSIEIISDLRPNLDARLSKVSEEIEQKQIAILKFEEAVKKIKYRIDNDIESSSDLMVLSSTESVIKMNEDQLKEDTELRNSLKLALNQFDNNLANYRSDPSKELSFTYNVKFSFLNPENRQRQTIIADAYTDHSGSKIIGLHQPNY